MENYSTNFVFCSKNKRKRIILHVCLKTFETPVLHTLIESHHVSKRCISKSAASRSREMFLPFCLVVVKLQLFSIFDSPIQEIR